METGISSGRVGLIGPSAILSFLLLFFYCFSLFLNLLKIAIFSNQFSMESVT